MKELATIMEECWAERPQSRHTAYKIKKDLNRLIDVVFNKTNSSETTLSNLTSLQIV
jgi:hypothetical protein